MDGCPLLEQHAEVVVHAGPDADDPVHAQRDLDRRGPRPLDQRVAGQRLLLVDDVQLQDGHRTGQPQLGGLPAARELRGGSGTLGQRLFHPAGSLGVTGLGDDRREGAQPRVELVPPEDPCGRRPVAEVLHLETTPVAEVPQAHRAGTPGRVGLELEDVDPVVHGQGERPRRAIQVGRDHDLDVDAVVGNLDLLPPGLGAAGDLGQPHPGIDDEQLLGGVGERVRVESELSGSRRRRHRERRVRHRGLAQGRHHRHRRGLRQHLRVRKRLLVRLRNQHSRHHVLEISLAARAKARLATLRRAPGPSEERPPVPRQMVGVRAAGRPAPTRARGRRRRPRARATAARRATKRSSDSSPSAYSRSASDRLCCEVALAQPVRLSGRR